MTPSKNKLLFAAIRNGKVRMLVALLDSGADPNAREENFKTPLLVASQLDKGDLRTHVIRVLINHSADVNLQDREGTTPLMVAASQLGSEDILRLIVRTGHCDPNIADIYGDSALFHAVAVGNARAIRILVNNTYTKYVISVDQRNLEGVTPLQFAMMLCQEECVKVLVNEGNANISHVQNKKRLYHILDSEVRKIPNINILECETLGATGTDMPTGSMSSLRLDKISIHNINSRRNSTCTAHEEVTLDVNLLQEKLKLGAPADKPDETTEVKLRRTSAPAGGAANSLSRKRSKDKLISSSDKQSKLGKATRPKDEKLAFEKLVMPRHGKRRGSEHNTQEIYNSSLRLCKSTGSLDFKLLQRTEHPHGKLQPLPPSYGKKLNVGKAVLPSIIGKSMISAGASS